MNSRPDPDGGPDDFVADDRRSGHPWTGHGARSDVPWRRFESGRGAAGRDGGIGVTRRILVIEDMADAADSLRDALEYGGHQVEVAYDGRAGIDKAREFHPDVVLCDIGLPGMDGYEVARALRSEAELSGVHLVAITGYALPEDQRRAVEAGFERHLVKPPSLYALEALLAAL